MPAHQSGNKGRVSKGTRLIELRNAKKDGYADRVIFAALFQQAWGRRRRGMTAPWFLRHFKPSRELAEAPRRTSSTGGRHGRNTSHPRLERHGR